MERSIQEQFFHYHLAHPEVYRTLVALARKMRARGVHHVGIGHLWEVMRWTLWVEGGSTEGYRLNNNYRSRYARFIMEQEQDLADFFTVRVLKAA